MSVNVWAFLVSRNPYLDYRTAVAPDFICQAKVSSLLARAADGEANDPGKGYFRKVIGSKVGDFSIAFRVTLATSQDLVLDQRADQHSSHDPVPEETALKDPFGREIYLVKGIVIQAVDSSREILLSNQDIEQVHQSVARAYGQFWQLEEARPAVPSSAMSLNLLEPSAQPLEFEELPPLVLSKLAISMPENPPSPPPSQGDSQPLEDRLETPLESRDQHPLEQNRTEINRPTSPKKARSVPGPSIPTSGRRDRLEDRASRFSPRLALIAAGTALLALITLSLVTRASIFSGNAASLCTTVRFEPLVLIPGTSIKKELNALKNQSANQEKSIFISGSLPLRPNARLLQEDSPLNKREPLASAERTQVVYFANSKVFRAERSLSYTLVLGETELRLEDHPLDLAIAQLSNQKIDQVAYLQAKTILRQKC